MDRKRSDLQIRPLAGQGELEACVRLQEEVWGGGFSERVPTSTLKVVARIGGVCAGAFDERGELVGFVFGFAGIEGGAPIHWSHMLAVRPGARGGGIGRALKSHQREVLLERGVTRCYWTFDPLEGRNGWLNLAKLGVVVREYVAHMYGESESHLHSGAGTDRFIAVWEMDSERVEDRLAGRETPPRAGDFEDLPLVLDVDSAGDLPVPAGAHRIPSDGPFLLPVPLDLEDMLSRDAGLALRWRAATRPILQEALDGSREVRELIRLGKGVGAYLVVRK